MPIETELDTSALSEVALVGFSQNEKELAEDFIAHYGIRGQKWGVRRFQNSDGSLTTLGRARYGVGAAAKKTGAALGKAGSAAGKAIGKAARKAVGRQTDEELDAELAKARKSHERQMKRDEINDLTGKKKKLSQMTDAEVDQYINRLSKEKSVRQAEKELKRMNRNAAQNLMSDLGKAAASGAVEGVKRGVGYQIQKSFEKASDRHQQLKDAKYKEAHKDLLGKEDDDFKKAADKNRNKLSATRDDLEYKALKGDKQAAKTLRNVAEAKKGKKNESSRSNDQTSNKQSDASKSKKDAKSNDKAVEADSYEVPKKGKNGSVTYDIVQRTPTTKETRDWMNEMARHKML